MKHFTNFIYRFVTDTRRDPSFKNSLYGRVCFASGMFVSCGIILVLLILMDLFYPHA